MAFRGAASQANSSTSTSVTVTVSGIGGTGPQNGDIVLFYMDGGGGGGSSTLTAPSGFSAVPGISQSLNFNTQNMVWYKVAGASEPSTYTATSNQNDFHAAQVRVYSGRNTGSPFTAVSAFHTSSGSSPLSVDFTGVTAATGDDLVVIGGIDNQSTASTYTFAAPSGYANAQSGSTNTSFAVAAFGADKVNASSGATGTVSGSLTFTAGSTDTGGWLIAIAQGSVAPPATTAWQPIRPLNPPGASPGNFGRFYQSPKAYNAAVNVTAALTGQSATFAGGTATPTVSAALTGQAGTFATGALTPSSSIGLAGQAATFAAGTIIPNTAVSLTGQAASFSGGLLSPSGSLGLSGQSATFSAGTLTPNTSVAVTGKVATFGAGTMTTGNDVTVSLTGQAAAFTAGILAPSTTLVLNGGASSFAAGNLLATPTIGLGGQSGTFSAGTLSPASSAPLQGLQASFTGGVLGVVGDVTVALSGQSATFTAGTVSVPQSQTNDAGRRIRNIYRVTIDGQVFEFRTLQEALKLLDQAKELAAKVAEDTEIWQQTPKPPPEIKVSSRELRKAAAETKREIKATYERAALHAELRMLLELSRRREEDETLLLLM